MAYEKPIPEIRPWTLPFWEGAKQGRLMLQKGSKSGQYIMYPKKYSPYDYREAIEWVEASGRGTIYTFTEVRLHATKEFQEEMPFVLAVVELEEGVRLCTNIVGSDPEKIKIGAPVRAVFEKATDEITLVKFQVEA